MFIFHASDTLQRVLTGTVLKDLFGNIWLQEASQLTCILCGLNGVLVHRVLCSLTLLLSPRLSLVVCPLSDTTENHFLACITQSIHPRCLDVASFLPHSSLNSVHSMWSLKHLWPYQTLIKKSHFMCLHNVKNLSTSHNSDSHRF